MKGPKILGHRRVVFALACVWALGLGACKARHSGTARGQDPAAPSVSHKPPASKKPPAPRRIVAIGDLHGDFAATQRVLALAGLTDAQGHWSGGATILVQTGDLLDRGDDEPEILQLLWRLKQEAPQSGGRVELLLGNHEIMNVQGDLRYVTPDGFEDYAKTKIPAQWPTVDAKAMGLPPGYIGRKAAFAPGSTIAQAFAQQKVAVVVGDTVFVHGGLSPTHARTGLDTLNRETQAWLQGRAPAPSALKDPQGPVWHRDYGIEPGPQDCHALTEALDAVGAKRMVIGHTVQPTGISAACDDRVWRIDVGMARHYGGQAQALEILGDKVRVLSAR